MRDKLLAEPQVHGGALLDRDQRISSLVNAIVNEPVRALEEIDQLLAARLNEPGVQFPLGDVVNDSQHRGGCDIAETGTVLQRL